MWRVCVDIIRFLSKTLWICEALMRCWGQHQQTRKFPLRRLWINKMFINLRIVYDWVNIKYIHLFTARPGHIWDRKMWTQFSNCLSSSLFFPPFFFPLVVCVYFGGLRYGRYGLIGILISQILRVIHTFCSIVSIKFGAAERVCMCDYNEFHGTQLTEWWTFLLLFFIIVFPYFVLLCRTAHTLSQTYTIGRICRES